MTEAPRIHHTDSPIVTRTDAWLMFLAFFVPMLPLLCLTLSWLLAFACLGHPPRPYGDKPLFLPLICWASQNLTFGSIIVFLPGTLFTLAACASKWDGSLRETVVIGIALFIALGNFAVYLADPMGAVTWLFR